MIKVRAVAMPFFVTLAAYGHAATAKPSCVDVVVQVKALTEPVQECLPVPDYPDPSCVEVEKGLPDLQIDVYVRICVPAHTKTAR